MFKKFRKKPIVVEAFQFTKQMHKDLIALGEKPYENPISVKLPDIPDADTYWNWFAKQLYLNTSEGEMQVNVSDWIIREPFDKVRKYYPVKNEIFVQTYDPEISGIETGAKHTKGEWFACCTDKLPHQVFSGNKTICAMRCNHPGHFAYDIMEEIVTEEECKANAKLIEAAPNMLNALTSITGIEAWITDPEMKKLFHDKVYSAIKKATE